MLSALSMDVVSGGGTYSQMSISLAHTSVSALTTSFENNYEGNQDTVVFSRSSFSLNSDPPGWKEMTFDTPFAYNGTDNLLIEIRWASGTDTTITRTTSESGNKRTLLAIMGATTGTLQGYRSILQLSFLAEREISGYIRDRNGTGVGGINMTGLPDTPVTDANGQYHATIAENWSGTVTPEYEDYIFVPASRTYENVTQDMQLQNHSAFATTESNGDICMRPEMENVYVSSGIISAMTVKPGLPEHLYSLQYMLDLTDADGWQNVSGQTQIPGTGEPIEMFLEAIENESAAFYRVLMEPAP